MLGTLLKYEFKATGRLLLPVYGLMILVALIAGLTMSSDGGAMVSDTLNAIIVLIFVGLAVASVVMTLVITIQRFSNNLLTDEGYLMFTLPVSTVSLIFSKLITAVCWCIIGTIAGMISGFALSIRVLAVADFHLFELLNQIFSAVSADVVIMMICAFVSFILGYAIFVLIIYTSLSVGQLPVAGKHKKGASLLAFFGIYIIFMILSSVFDSLFMDALYNMSTIPGMLISIGIELVVAAVMFFATYFILDKHLNLE